MSNYVQATNFATKDALPSGDPLKIVRGTEINTEFNNIATAVATKADTNSPTLVTPALGTPVSGNLANCTFPTLNQNTTGNAGTATALQNARNIGGVSFDGTVNINLPGVNTAGNQNTSGNAATANTANTANTVTTITTNQVLAATAGASVGAVGTYCKAFFLTGTSNPGATVAGSDLRGVSGINGSMFNPSFSGTWRNMGASQSGTTQFTGSDTMWLRIS